MSGVVSLEYLDIVRFYLFGEVRFLDLLLLLMALDILSGIFNAVRCGNLWSRKSLFGYARKVLVLMVIVLANVLDQILSLNEFGRAHVLTTVTLPSRMHSSACKH